MTENTRRLASNAAPRRLCHEASRPTLRRSDASPMGAANLGRRRAAASSVAHWGVALSLAIVTAAVAGSSTGTVSAATTFATQPDIAVTADGAFSVAAADLDNDGFVDLASASFDDDTIAWYSNNGDGTFTTEPDIDVTADGASSVTAADLDNDGFIDLASASFDDDTIAWYLNNGDGTFTTQPDIATTADGARSVTAADLDNDGFVDLASASFTDDTIAWYLNNGDGTFTTEPDIDVTADGASSVTAADLDNDGFVDLASASFNDDTIAWYLNNGDGTFTTQADIATTADAALSVAAADLDSDGDIDLASASRNDDTIAWYRNDPTDAPIVDAGGPYTVADGETVALAATTSDPDGGTPSLAWDFDGDGQFDDATGLNPIYDAAVFGAPGVNAITVEATDNEASTATDTATVTITSDPTVDADAVTSLAPARFVDTRPTGATVDGDNEGEGRRPADSEYRVQIAGRGDVPLGASAAVINITAVQPDAVGYLTAHPCVDPRPNASSLNYTTAVNLGNEVILPLTATGELCLYTSASTHLTLDVVGFVDATSTTGLLTPARFLDTRSTGVTIDSVSQGTGQALAGTEVTLQVAGRGDIPDDAAAVIVYVTAIQADQIGYITAHACLATPPNAASLNYTAGINRGNELIVELDPDGKLCLFTSADVHLTADVAGYIPADTNLTTIAPSRLLDTRTAGETIDGLNEGAGARVADTELRLPIVNRANIPATATAVVLNVTAVQPEQLGYITVHPCNDPRPNTASLNYVTGVNGGNEIVIQLDAGGGICIYTSSTTHLTVDVTAHIA